MAIHKLTVRKVDTAGPGQIRRRRRAPLGGVANGCEEMGLAVRLAGQTPGDGAGPVSGCRVGRRPDPGAAGTETGGDRGGPDRGPPSDPGDESCLYDLRRTVYPSPSAQLAECQAYAAMGPDAERRMRGP